MDMPPDSPDSQRFTGPTIVAVGELLVEFVSHNNGCELRELSEYSGPYPSGAPAICIDQASQTGALTSLYGGVGADNFGNALVQRLKQNGVNTAGIAQLPALSTGVAFVSYYEDGSRTFIFHLNNTAADGFDTDAMLLPRSPCLMHISGSSLGNPHLRTAIESTAEQVLQHGGAISCDPNVRPELMDNPSVTTLLQSLIEKSTYLFPSEVDLQYLYPQYSIRESIQKLLSSGVGVVLLTRAEFGATLFTASDAPVDLPGHSVTE
ncbi:MAG: PfkB family carbohydrate kinase, partial [Pseudomonadota bacterium]